SGPDADRGDAHARSYAGVDLLACRRGSLRGRHGIRQRLRPMRSGGGRSGADVPEPQARVAASRRRAPLPRPRLRPRSGFLRGARTRAQSVLPEAVLADRLRRLPDEAKARVAVRLEGLCGAPYRTDGSAEITGP